MSRDNTFMIPAVTVVIVAAALIRIYFSGEPLWVDELHTAWTVDASLGDVASRAAQGNQTPLYFLIQFLVGGIAGISELSLRSSSIVCSVLCVPAAAYFVWYWTNHAFASVVAAILVASDSWSVFYGSEARPYAMLQFLAVVQLFFFVQVCTGDPKATKAAQETKIHWPLAFATSALLLTHLASLFLIASEIFAIGLFANRSNVRRAIFSFAISAISTIAAAPTLMQVLKNRSDWQSINQPATLLTNLLPALVAYLIIPLLLFCICMRIERTKISAASCKLLFPCITAGLGPILLAGILGYGEVLHVAYVRFVSYSPIILATCAGLIVAQTNNARLVTGSAMIVVALSILFNPLSQSAWLDSGNVRLRNEDWRSVVSRLNENQTGDQPLIFLFANLVEDHRVSDNRQDDDLINYLKFPLDCLYKPNRNATVVPMATVTQSSRWKTADLQWIERNNGASIVVRSGFDLLNDILDDLKQTASESDYELKIEIERQPGNILTIAKVHVVE